MCDRLELENSELTPEMLNHLGEVLCSEMMLVDPWPDQTPWRDLPDTERDFFRIYAKAVVRAVDLWRRYDGSRYLPAST